MKHIENKYSSSGSGQINNYKEICERIDQASLAGRKLLRRRENICAFQTLCFQK